MFRKLILVFCGFILPMGAFAQTRIISHVTRPDGGFTSTVFVENRSMSETTVTLSPFDSSGTALTPGALTLGAGETRALGIEELFEDGGSVSHFQISDNEDVAVTLAYDFQRGNGSPAHVGASDQRASSWRIFPGNWDQIFDGLAIVNTGTEATEIWIAQKDFQGKVLNARRITERLAPMAKSLYVIGSPAGSDFSPRADTFFELSASQNLAITALRGTLAGADVGLLWANEARTLSRSESARDEKSVWFITGGSLYDVHEMMGYNVAVDRLWQLELFRRSARGKLAEVFGFAFANQDVAARTAGYSDEDLAGYYDALDEDGKIAIRGYVDGINRRIGQVNGIEELINQGQATLSAGFLPFEFRVFNLQAQPWSTLDVLAWMASLQRQFALPNLGIEQVQNGALLQDLQSQFGEEQGAIMFNDLRWVNDPAAITMIPPTIPQKRQTGKPLPLLKARSDVDIRDAARNMAEAHESNRERLKEIGAFVKLGSYAWVVSGDKTQSGNPILFSGPQLGFGAPVVVVEGSIESEALTVSGMTVPGFPAFIVGRTPHHSWSIQQGHTHSWDYYLEDQNDIFVDRVESIRVNGVQVGQNVDIFHTARGPLLNANPPMSWKYAHWGREFDLGKGFLAMARAQNADQFGEGVANIGASLHVCYADREGNIAYWMSGRNPVRPEGDYRVPQGLAGPALDYDAETIHPLVHDRNPAQGWYGGWNTKAGADIDDPTGTFSFGPFNRGHVIQDYLAANNDLTIDGFRDFLFQIAGSTNAFAGGYLWPYLRDELGFMNIVQNNSTGDRDFAIDVLQNWDGAFIGGGIENWHTSDFLNDAWILQRMWVLETANQIFGDELGETLLPDLVRMRFGAMVHSVDPNSAVQADYNWFLETPAGGEKTFEQYVSDSLDVVLNRLGDQPWDGVIPEFNGRPTLDFNHNLFGLMYNIPLIHFPTYCHFVEMGPEGPVRIDSAFGLGQSGTILATDQALSITEAGTRVGAGITPDPLPDDHFFSMSEYFDVFQPRSFPIFKTKK